jgi:spore germination cell wall hydrolase CwlJ-like protein
MIRKAVICSLILSTTISLSVIPNFAIADSADPSLLEDKAQIACLAENIYYEAGAEPKSGQLAVAMVTINRVNSGKFPDDICSVVKQRSSKGCQFSWVCFKRPKMDKDLYNKVLNVATHVYNNYPAKIKDITFGSLYYHADHIDPRWNLRRTVVIGNHIFYTNKKA